MAKIYSLNPSKKSHNPKKETISFLLNYSKSFKVIKVNQKFINFYLN